MATANIITPAQPGPATAFANSITPAEAATAIHHLEGARDILQRIGANVASTAIKREAFGRSHPAVSDKVEGECASPWPSYHESAEYAVELFDEIRKHEDRLLHLMYAIRDHMEPENGEEATDPQALALVEIAIGRLEEAAGWGMLADCLEAMKHAEVAK
jgi:hypothetical protein